MIHLILLESGNEMSLIYHKINDDLIHISSVLHLQSTSTESAHFGFRRVCIENLGQVRHVMLHDRSGVLIDSHFEYSLKNKVHILSF